MTAEEIARGLGEPRFEANNWKCRCPICGKDNLSLRDSPTGRLLINCWSGCDRKAIRRQLKERSLLNGRDLDPPPRGRPGDNPKVAAKIANALDIWRNNTFPLANTLGETYLASRLLLQEPMSATLRYSPAVYHPTERRTFPAVVALLEHEKLGGRAIHCICLNPLDPSVRVTIDTRKFSIGPVKGAAVRLFPAGPELALGEGIETCLAFQQSTQIPAWATVGGSGLVNFEPPPLDRVSTLILLEDQDEAGRKAVSQSAARFTAMGYRVRIARPLKGKDVNDALLTIGPDQPLCEIEDYQVGGVSLDTFFAYMPMHNYVFVPTRSTWPAASVDSRISPVALTDEAGAPVLDKNGKQILLKPSVWLDRFKPVEQMTWVPGEPMIINDKLIIEGGWIRRPGVRCFNLYHPPTIIPGDPQLVAPWLEHVRYVFADDAEHIFDWLAHRVQRPWDKINHALVLGGAQGIGKDTLLEPAKHAVGPWNCQEVSPTQILGRFNGFLKSVILRVNEARDLGEFDRFQLYDHMKAYTAAPPDVLRIDEKHLRETSIINCCGVIITTNHKSDGIFLPADDRRHYVAWSDRTKEDPRFEEPYWNDLWRWYSNGGLRHVTAFLQLRDLGNFNAKSPPKKTAAFWAIVDANRSPEEPELADAIETLNYPTALTLKNIQTAAFGDFADWLADRKNRRIIPHRLELCGYVPVRNPDADDGLWRINGRRQAVYANKTLALCDQISAAGQLVARQ
jgi:hypothetical protein